MTTERRDLILMKRKKQQFVFRFDMYDGSEENLEVYDGQVMEYEFVNQGTTLCIINSGLYLYPEMSGIQPNRVKLDIRANEMDVTIYKYKFKPLDYNLKTSVAPAAGEIPARYIPFVGAPIVVVGAVSFNRLLVISKVKATVETSNP